MKPYRSPLLKIATILFCILLAIILREIVMAESVESITPYKAPESILRQVNFEAEEQVGLSGKIIVPAIQEPETYTITAYCSCEICCGEWADGITYSGDFAHEGVTIAADLNKLPLGTKVWIEGIGERVVQDKGGAIKGNRIDVFFYNHADALKFGRQQLGVTVIE